MLSGPEGTHHVANLKLEAANRYLSIMTYLALGKFKELVTRYRKDSLLSKLCPTQSKSPIALSCNEQNGPRRKFSRSGRCTCSCDAENAQLIFFAGLDKEKELQ